MTDPILVCGSCADAIAAIGGVRVRREIYLGTLCQAHASDLPAAQATSAIVPPDSWVRPEPKPRTVAPELPELPDKLGPITTISVELLCAWSRGDLTRAADEEVLDLAVETAKDVLRRTKGA